MENKKDDVGKKRKSQEDEDKVNEQEEVEKDKNKDECTKEGVRGQQRRRKEK